MQDKILGFYLVFPFAIAVIVFANVFIKKSYTAELISGIFSIINFGFASYFLTIYTGEKYFSDNISFVFLFIFSLVFMFFIFMSKSCILKLKKLFYATIITLCGLINLFILSDNVFINLAVIFWFFLIYFLLTYSFCERKEEKRSLKTQLINDLIIYLTGIFLISYNFIRYFIVNDVSLNFLNIEQCSNYIGDKSLISALGGFLIIIFRLLNFPIFSYKSITNLKFLNNFSAGFIYIVSVFLGNILFIKVLSGFKQEYLQQENILFIYFIFNFLYLAILAFGQTNLIRFFAFLTSSVLNVGLISVFSVKSINLNIYYFITLIFSSILCFFISILLENKMKTKDVNNFKKIRNENKIIKSLILYSLFNMGNIPLLGLFTPFAACILSIFAQDYSLSYLNYLAYLLIFGFGLILYSGLNFLNKILIEPEDYLENKIEFSFSQKFIFIALVSIIVLTGYFGNYILNLA